MRLIYEDLTEPTYKLQEKETPRHHRYFKHKLFNGFSLRQLESYLKEVYDEIMGKSWANRQDLRNELKKYFHAQDVNKFLKQYDFDKKRKLTSVDYIPITRQVLESMSSDGCWVRREKDFEKDEDEEDLRDFKSQRKAAKREEFPKKQKVKSIVLDKIIQNSEKLTLSQINQGTQAYVNLDENDDKDLGLDSQKYDVNLQGDIKSESKTDLRTDLEKVQDQILSPAFAEVTRKLSTHLKEDSK